MPVYQIGSRRLTATISQQGAELFTLADASGRQLLWHGDARWWTGRSPLLFPIVGRLPADRARIDGVDFAMPQHGFARNTTFALLEASATSCVLELRSTSSLLQRYPRAFALTVTYAVDGDTLSISARVANEDRRPMPFSFGFHPAFRWPLAQDQAREDHEILFEHDEPAPIRRPQEGLLALDSEATPVQARRLKLRDELFVPGALAFDALRSRTVTYGRRGRPELEVAFPHMPHLGIWTKPGAPFICIEPWQGYAAPVGFAGELRDKPGIVELAPQEARTYTMRITVLP